MSKKRYSPSKIHYNEYFRYMRETTSLVDEVIVQYIKKHSNEDSSLEDILIEPFHGRLGKPKLRGTSFRLVYELLCDNHWEEIIPVVASMEVIDTSHYACDDVFDTNIQDRQEINERLIASHILRSIATDMILSVKDNFSSEIINDILNEKNQLDFRVNKTFHLEFKLDNPFSFKIYQKRIFGFAFLDNLCYMAATLAGADKERRESLVKFGENLGQAYMIANDICDVAKSCEDLKSKKMTLPVYIAMRKSKGIEYESIMRVFGNWEATEEEIENAQIAFLKSEVIDSTKKIAENYVKRAISYLDIFQNSKQKELLIFTSRIVSYNKFYKKLENLRRKL